MSDPKFKQRLAAIVAAEADGYSRLMASDDRGTVEALDGARAVFKSVIESNQGRVIDMAGDSVLAQISRLLHNASRTEDIVCRYGGEEFAVILREIDERGAARYAERIRRRVERADFQFIDKDGSQRSIKTTISVGLATLGVTRFATVDDFITAADKQLYHAKRTGRNRVSGDGEG